MGILERKEREKEERRQSIIDAAERVFFSKGFDATTVDEIAEAAELSKGTIYLYFKGKESLYTAVTNRALTILGEEFRKAAAGAERGIDKLMKIGEAYLRFALEHEDYFWALVSYEARKYSADAGDETIAACRDEGMKTISFLIGAVEAGIADGSVTSRYSPVTLALLLWGTSMGLIQMNLVKREFLTNELGIDMKDIMVRYFELIGGAIRA